MKFLIKLLPIVLLIASCKKEEEPQPLETGTVTDVDGHSYQTVKIGNTWWMAENLEVTHYRDGSLIADIPVGEDSLWAAQTTGASCQTDERYGRLYNFFAVSDSRGIAPEGWHIATDAEWKALEMALGMKEDEAGATAWRGTTQCEQLIPEASQGWPSSTVPYGNNKSGFSGLPGGCRLFDGSTNSQSSMAFWWTASTNGSQAWYRYLDSQKKTVFRHYTYANYGFSVRCVKD